MYYVQDAHSFWDWIYFVLLIVVSVVLLFWRGGGGDFRGLSGLAGQGSDAMGSGGHPL